MKKIILALALLLLGNFAFALEKCGEIDPVKKIEIFIYNEKK